MAFYFKNRLLDSYNVFYPAPWFPVVTHPKLLAPSVLMSALFLLPYNGASKEHQEEVSYCQALIQWLYA